MTAFAHASVVYLHGFASSPGSTKARAFDQALRARHVEAQIPDLNEGDFRNLTVSRQLATLDRLTASAAPRSVVVIGSSLGGYTSAIFAAQSDKVAALVLMAPAFDFARRWAERLGPEQMQRWQRDGQTLTFHHRTGRDELIGFGLMQDAASHPPFPDVRVPTLIIHGRQDDVVDPDLSVRFARERANVDLELIDADHGLSGAVDWVVARSLSWLERLVE